MALGELGKLLLEFGDPIALSVVLLVTRGAIVYLLGEGASSLIQPTRVKPQTESLVLEVSPHYLYLFGISWLLTLGKWLQLSVCPSSVQGELRPVSTFR